MNAMNELRSKARAVLKEAKELFNFYRKLPHGLATMEANVVAIRKKVDVEYTAQSTKNAGASRLAEIYGEALFYNPTPSIEYRPIVKPHQP